MVWVVLDILVPVLQQMDSSINMIFVSMPLDADLNLEAGLDKAQLLEAMDGHILGTGLLMGHYERKE